MHAPSTDAIPPRQAFVCPSCGLLCDDMPDPGPASTPAAWSGALQTLCPRAARGIDRWAATLPQARIDGAAVDAADALREAARRLRGARRPVFGGMAADVQSARAALALADRCGARVTHRGQAAIRKNIFALQGHGAFNTTLAEAAHRAALVLVVGGDVAQIFPRLFERLFVARPAFVDAAARRLVSLAAPAPSRVPPGVVHEAIDAGGLDVFEAVAALRAAVRQPGLPALAERIPPALAGLAQRLLACPYGVVVWAAPQLPEACGEILVEQLQQLVLDLNGATRWAALPLGGNFGDISANAVSTWQTGFALPVEFTAGTVAYDPYPDYADADLLLWIDTFEGDSPGRLPGLAADTSLIRLGALDAQAPLPPRHVVLPAAFPGITSSGHLVRTDTVITVYAPAVRPTALPAAARVLEDLGAAFDAEERA